MKKTVNIKSSSLDELDQFLLLQIEQKGRGWMAENYHKAGYASHTVINRIMNSRAYDLKFVALMAHLLGLPEIETSKFAVTCQVNDLADLITAVGQLKQNLRAERPPGVTYRDLSEKLGYSTDSGTLSRSMRSNSWAPVEMLYQICVAFHCDEITGRHNDTWISFRVKKTPAPTL